MVTLPDATALGRRPVMRPQRDVIGAPVAAATAPAREMGAAGRAATELGDRILDRLATTEARDIDSWVSRQVGDLLYNPETGYFAQQGRNAIGGRAGIAEQLERLREEAIGRASNNTSRERLAGALQSRIDGALSDIDRHALGELRTYEQNVRDAALISARENALADPSRLTASLDAIDAIIADEAEAEGWSPEQTAITRRTRRSEVFRDQIEALMVHDPVEALELLDEYDDEMLASDALALRDALIPLAAERRGRDWADALFQVNSNPVISPNGSPLFTLNGEQSGMTRPEAAANMEEVLAGPYTRMTQLFGGDVPILDAIARDGTSRETETPGSQHFHGNAIDIDISGMSPDEQWRVLNAALDAGFTGIGVGPGSLHVDVGAPRQWDYGSTFAGRPIGEVLAHIAARRTEVAQGGGAAASDVDAGTIAAANLIAGYEGFRTDPYYDVNALRAGYGSDTVTHADGTVERVTSSTRVTREDAQRDLLRRIDEEFRPAARLAVGETAWRRLTPQQQAVLTSLSYNYGANAWGDTLLDVATAVTSGDMDAAVRAIRGLATHNNGVNRGRRLNEAQIFQAGGESGVAGSMPSVADAMAIYQGIEDPREAEVFWTRYTRNAQMAGIQRDQLQRQSHLAAWEAIEGGQTYEQLPQSLRLELGPEAAASLRAYSERINAGAPPPTTDPYAYAHLRRIEAENGGRLPDTENPLDYIDRLSPADLRGFIDRQTEAPDPVAAGSLSSIMTQADTLLEGYGFDVNGAPGSAGAQARAQVQMDMAQWQDRFIRENQQLPTPAQINEQLQSTIRLLGMRSIQPDQPLVSGRSPSEIRSAITPITRTAGITDETAIAALEIDMLTWQEDFIASNGRPPEPYEIQRRAAEDLTTVRIQMGVGTGWRSGRRVSEIDFGGADRATTRDDLTMMTFFERVGSGNVFIADVRVTREDIETVAEALVQAVPEFQSVDDIPLEVLVRGLSGLYRR